MAEGTSAELKRLVPGGHIRMTFRDPGELAQATAAFGGSSPDEESLSLQIPSDGGVSSLRAVLDRLDQASVAVDDLSIHTPDLDDVFFALTGRDTPQEVSR